MPRILTEDEIAELEYANVRAAWVLPNATLEDLIFTIRQLQKERDSLKETLEIMEDTDTLSGIEAALREERETAYQTGYENGWEECREMVINGWKV